MVRHWLRTTLNSIARSLGNTEFWSGILQLKFLFFDHLVSWNWLATRSYTLSPGCAAKKMHSTLGDPRRSRSARWRCCTPLLLPRLIATARAPRGCLPPAPHSRAALSSSSSHVSNRLTAITLPSPPRSPPLSRFSEYRFISKKGEGTFSDVLKAEVRRALSQTCARPLRASNVKPTQRRDCPPRGSPQLTAPSLHPTPSSSSRSKMAAS